MKRAKLLVFIISILNLAACDRFVDSKDKGLVDMKKIEQRWFDAVEITDSTSRIALPPQVASLQTIKRDLDVIDVSECLKPAKTALNEDMEITIKDSLDFMGHRKTYAAEDIIARFDRKNKYTHLRNSCAY